MIRETFYSQIGHAYHDRPLWGTGAPPQGEIFFIMRKPPAISHRYQNLLTLSPSFELLHDWQVSRRRKYNKMSWQEYTERFLQEMKNAESQANIKRLAEQSHDRDIWLVCSCFNDRKECHRFLVMDLIMQAGGAVEYGRKGISM